MAEALRWLAILKDAPVSQSDRQAFDAWLAGSRENAEAWRRAGAVWDRLEILAPAAREWSAGAGIDGPAVLHVVPPAFLKRPASTTRRNWLRAAAAVVVVGGAGYLAGRTMLQAEHRTGPAERRAVALADGSLVELAGSTALSTSFDAKERHVILHEGEAYFAVALDPARPFLVTAAGGRTRALGTAFDVKHVGHEVSVAVLEHAVAVSVEGAPPVTISAGQQVRYGAGWLSPARAVDAAIVGAWRRDRLIFEEAPLGDVVADLERNLPGKIFVTDARINAIPVTAVFDVHEADGALRTIAATLPVEVHRLTDFLIVLSPKE